jgi:hypothetical protein
VINVIAIFLLKILCKKIPQRFILPKWILSFRKGSFRRSFPSGLLVPSEEDPSKKDPFQKNPSLEDPSILSQRILHKRILHKRILHI